MKSTLRFLIPALFLLAQPVMAQQPPDDYCGTRGITPWFEWYTQHRAEFAQNRGVDTPWLYIPVTVQLTSTDAGLGYFNLEQVIIALNNMNQQFTPAKIRYYLVPGDPFRFLNSDYWNDHGWDGGADMISQNRLPNRLNAYVVKNPAGNCGYSWMDAIVLGRSCSGALNTTWAHEAGHHFSLPHPFYGWEGETWNYSNPAPAQVGGSAVEKMDGSNCYTSGDFLCDTRPDYLNYRWSCDQNKESTVLQHDPNNVPFRSDASLYMSYASDVCASRFSPEQITAMRDNIMTEHNEYLQITDPLQEIAEDDLVELISPLDTAYVQYDNATFSWNPVPNASLYTIEIALKENNNPRFVWETVYNTTTITLTQHLPLNRILYWRVRPYSEWDLSKQVGPQQIGVFRTFNYLATNELERLVVAELSPNPVASGAPATLKISSEENMEAQLTVFDIAGRSCHAEAVKLQTGENLIEIPTARLHAGLYMVTLKNEKGTVVKRLAVTD